MDGTHSPGGVPADSGAEPAAAMEGVASSAPAGDGDADAAAAAASPSAAADASATATSSAAATPADGGDDNASPAASGAVASETATAGTGTGTAATAAAAGAVRPRMPPWTYGPGEIMPDLSEWVGEVVEVWVPGRHATLQNERVLERQLWGSDFYTDDSDVVACALHSGVLAPLQTPPSYDLAVWLRVHPRYDNYPSTSRRNLRSRHWTQPHDGVSFKVLRVREIFIDDLQPAALAQEEEASERERRTYARALKRRKTKQSMSATGRVFLPEVSVMLSLSQEPCLKYTLNLVADRGVKEEAWTSYRLRTEVLFLETASKRYQLWRSSPATAGSAAASSNGGAGAGGKFDRYSLALVCRAASLTKAATDRIGYPLDVPHVDVVERELDWAQIQWGPKSVHIRGTCYPVVRMWWRACAGDAQGSHAAGNGICEVLGHTHDGNADAEAGGSA